MICGLWGLVFTGFPYAVALKTGNPAAVNACFVIFFPLFFLTDAVIPKGALTGWFSTYCDLQPCDLSARSIAIADHDGLGRHSTRRRYRCHGRHWLPQYVLGVSGTSGASSQQD